MKKFALWVLITATLSLSVPQIALGGPYEDADAAYSRGDFVTAAQLLRAPAEQGHVAARNLLGIMLAAGQGVQRSDEQAVYWFRKAAEQGYPGAQTNLGFMYENGRGLQRDDVQAANWYRAAAQQGNVDAQKKLAALYSAGRGISPADRDAWRESQRPLPGTQPAPMTPAQPARPSLERCVFRCELDAKECGRSARGASSIKACIAAKNECLNSCR